MSLHDHVYIAIMAGGVGSRFWPASRSSCPKQFLDMMGTGQSLLQMTHQRFRSMVDADHLYCVTNETYTALVQEQLPEMPLENVIGEPSRNNTAPSVLYTAMLIARRDPDAIIGFVPSDHLILKEINYLEKVNEAIAFAQDHAAIVTLGIQPVRPDTGYGYIKYDKSAAEGNVHPVLQFTEKPDLEKAQRMLSEGNFLWNAGMFFMKVSTLLAAYMEQAPDLYELFQPVLSIEDATEDKSFLKSQYPLSRNVSIDYAIIEKSSNVYTIPSDIGWSDLGTWASLYHEMPKDPSGNAILSQSTVLQNVSNSLVRNNTNKLIILRDVHNLIVVDEEDVLLIYPMEKEQEIKQLSEMVNDKYAKFL